MRPQFSFLLCLAVVGCATESPPDSGVDEGGSDPSSGGVPTEEDTDTDPTGEGPTADGDTDDADTDDGDTDDGETDGCDTEGCEVEGYECLSALAYDGGLLATANRSALCPDCGEHGASQGVLLAVDPQSGERTELGVAAVKQTFEMLAIAPDGGLVVGGSTFLPDSLSYDPLLQKYTADGALSWTSPSTFGVADFAIRGDEILVVSGHGTADLTVVSGEDGSILEQLEGGVGRTQSIAVDDGGNVYVAGDAVEIVDGKTVAEESFVRKYDAELQLEWEQFAPPSLEGAGLAAPALVVDEDGGVIVAIRQSPEEGPSTLAFRKYDDAGTEQWVSTLEIGDPAKEATHYLFGLHARPGGGLVAIGQTGGRDDSAFTVAYDGGGVPLWSDVQAHADLSHEINEGLVIASDTVFVAGCARGEPDDLAWLLEFEP
ncbi:MAG: hypothetical protein AAF799_20490 [Myxococcota bacterium]